MSIQTVVLVSGAGLPGWIWDGLRAELGDNNTVVAERAPGGDASIADHAEAALAGTNEERVLVVAHSVGGVIAQEMLRRAPERVSGVLGLSAAFPRAGQSFAGAMPFPQRVVLPVLLRLAGTRPPESAIRSGAAAGLPAEVTDRIVADFATESRALFTGRVQEGGGGVFGYVSTTADRELPVALQRRFAGTVGARWLRDLATGHLPMIEDPAAVARAVRDFSRERVQAQPPR